MKSTYLIIRLAKVVSLLGALGFLLLAYYYLPQKIAIHYNESGVPDNFLNREPFFYVFCGFVLLLNMAISFIGRLVLGLPNRALAVPNRAQWLADAESREQLMYVLRNWLNGLAALLNVFLLAVLYATVRLHTNSRVFLSDFTWLLFAGLALLLAWAAYLPLRLRMAKPVAAE